MMPLTEALGLKIEYREWDKKSALPLYMTSVYEFRKAAIDDFECLVILPLGVQPTIPALKKDIRKIRQTENLPVVIKSKTISDFRRKNMMANRLPFITEKQIYLPFMATFLQKENAGAEEVTQFTPSAMLLLLKYFYGHERKPYIFELAAGLPFTSMTLTRAVRQLEAVDLFNVTKDGVRKLIESEFDKRELYARIKKYMISPVKRRGFVKREDISEDMLLSGISALSEKTMLNAVTPETYAVYAKRFDGKKLQKELVDPEKQAELELWSYDPRLFGDDKTVDAISLALSLGNTSDERTEQAKKELLENIWRIQE